MLLEKLELPRFAEEVRFVGADAVQHVDPLPLILFDEAVVGAEVEVQLTQPPRQPSFHQYRLGIREEDARLAQDELLKEAELAHVESPRSAERARARGPVR